MGKARLVSVRIVKNLRLLQALLKKLGSERERLRGPDWQPIVIHRFPGLDSQITTGRLDAPTGVACPALDSDVKCHH
jgi:hypothetical protein